MSSFTKIGVNLYRAGSVANINDGQKDLVTFMRLQSMFEA